MALNAIPDSGLPFADPFHSATSSTAGFIFLLFLFAVGFWLWRDTNRFARHVEAAERMIAAGISEPDAMEQSGCNFWDLPFYLRFGKSYPDIPHLD